MSTTSDGRRAEESAAQHLIRRGHTIIDTNWRTRWCEIDIVSKKGDVVYFTEVKYRKSLQWGDGFDYITRSKLRQMKFAAEFWLTEHNWKGESQLLAASVNANHDVEVVEI